MLQNLVRGDSAAKAGERYSTIVRFLLPEYITSLIIYSMPFWIDSYFIGQLESTVAYAALGSTNNLVHLLIKIAEAFSIGTVIIAGGQNGRNDYHGAGRTIRDSFWITFALGLFFSTALFFGAQSIYLWYGVPHAVAQRGVPFLQLRAIGIFFTFISLAFIGFLRGVKNTRAPMKTFIFGALVFLFFDYVLIFGKCGFPRLGLYGSAWASLFQYVAISVILLGYILWNKKYYKYAINLFSILKEKSYVSHLASVSWPVILDKATMAMSYIWLGKMIAPMGTSCIATFCVIKDIERFAFLPAIACAQVITFLVSNDRGARNWLAISENIKRVVVIAFFTVFFLLFLFSLHIEKIVYFFDRQREFTELVVYAFPIVSILVIFDLLQLILSGALRGAGNVKTVMLVRFAVCFGYFMPVSYMLTKMPIQDEAIKFIAIYGSFYLGSGIMSIAYMYRFRSENWNKVMDKQRQ